MNKIKNFALLLFSGCTWRIWAEHGEMIFANYITFSAPNLRNVHDSTKLNKLSLAKKIHEMRFTLSSRPEVLDRPPILHSLLSGQTQVWLP